MNISEIIQFFKREFSPIQSKFEIIKILKGHKLDYEYIKNVQKPSENNNIIWHPGVYVFYGNKKVYRVGRHLSNSRYRVLHHIKINTKNNNHKISDLLKYKDAEIILFNVKNKDDAHWVAAVEIYLEKVLSPLIKSGKTG
jgi:hypothetical protein